MGREFLAGPGLYDWRGEISASLGLWWEERGWRKRSGGRRGEGGRSLMAMQRGEPRPLSPLLRKILVVPLWLGTQYPQGCVGVRVNRGYHCLPTSHRHPAPTSCTISSASPRNPPTLSRLPPSQTPTLSLPSPRNPLAPLQGHSPVGPLPQASDSAGSL
ncbi:tubulin-specific chaperone cofactor E-like protein [Platysternon megacephalum]|uniref:Tubulin-specific chaperone cofactor E-like protein n=1 Tax=Platysternon megacephalum TaxID=55544 RepID=A0A4D9DYK4_9SAUR|nr:tubulin-specific chaperone cofactor E-like protein [Platysternon megacephalum]